MKMFVTGEGKAEFVKGLKELINVIDSKECILLEIPDNMDLDSSQYINLLNKMDKPVTYGIL